MRRDPSSKSPIRRGGFNLFELTMVVAIVAVVAAIAAPRYAAASARYRADLAARRIVADLSLARTRAKTLSASQAVVFSPEAAQYQIPSLPGLDDSSAVYTVNLSDPPYNVETLAVMMGGGEPIVVFDGWGMPNAAARFDVSVGNEQRTIMLNPYTGKATIE